MSKEASQYLSDHSEELLAEWESRARAEVRAARDTQALALRNHLPEVLRDLQKALREARPGTTARTLATKGFVQQPSLEHGKQRASIKSYTVKQVVHEFIILRHVLTDRLAANGLASTDVVERIDRIIELGLLASTGSFAESLQQAREQLLGTLAHDIRTPLSVAYTSLELIGGMDPSESGEMRELAMRSIKRGLGMLGELLDSIRVEAGEGMTMCFAENDYKSEMEDVSKDVVPVYGDLVRFELPTRPIPAVFCPTSIRRLVENLVSNAVKHGADAGAVTVTLTDRSEDVQISVHNEGEPIPEEEKDEIFEFLNTPLKSNRPSGEGWGMGLTLVGLVANAHAGELRVRSSAPTGTTFTVRLRKRPHEPGKIRVGHKTRSSHRK